MRPNRKLRYHQIHKVYRAQLPEHPRLRRRHGQKLTVCTPLSQEHARVNAGVSTWLRNQSRFCYVHPVRRSVEVSESELRVYSAQIAAREPSIDILWLLDVMRYRASTESFLACCVLSVFECCRSIPAYWSASMVRLHLFEELPILLFVHESVHFGSIADLDFRHPPVLFWALVDYA